MNKLEDVSIGEEIDSVGEFDFGYNNSINDNFDISKQIERRAADQRNEQIANRRYSVANSRLINYLFNVQQVFNNGFLKLSEPRKEAILNDVHLKIKNIASSTGLVPEKIMDLTENYIYMANRVYTCALSRKTQIICETSENSKSD